MRIVPAGYVLILLLGSAIPEAMAQPVLPTDLKKPKKFENKQLGAEKSATKKFRGPRRFIQNTVTHYNWHFNAENKLNQVLEKARLVHRDDYSDLLSFYNYSLEQIRADSVELDSVIHKANTGILIHDLRNAWIDNLFMLMGKAYYFRGDLDSATLTFQHINYAFAPKEADGYDIPIGSNVSEGSGALSVATREKNGLIRRALSTPPSRNDALLWQVRTQISAGNMAAAASLIQTLRNDPQFPERLQASLAEIQALYCYENKTYDSAAFFLEKALPVANTRQEAARWEYLIGQLHARSGNREQAAEFFERARRRTLDPVLEVNAILETIRQRNTDSAAVEENLAALTKMGKREMYAPYRDIIFYTAARIELERGRRDAAKEMLLRSTAAAGGENPAQRSRSFLLLAELCLQERDFRNARRFYDSINANDPGVDEPGKVAVRQELLREIGMQLDIMARQDSVLHLASLPPAEREAILRRMVRQIRRQQGLKDEGESTGGTMFRQEGPADLFSADQKGEWYFLNAALKSKGYTAFRQQWGDRPNVDNWRRKSALVQGPIGLGQGGRIPQAPATAQPEGPPTLESLLRQLPLEPEQQQLRRDSIGEALAGVGIMLVDGLEDFSAARDSLEKFLDQYPTHRRRPEALYYLYLVYRRQGQEEKARERYTQLLKQYPGNAYQRKISEAVTDRTGKEKDEATRRYEQIYRSFIEGDFAQALELKALSDSLYGSRYWTPQLLYIESIYHIRSGHESAAKKVLQQMISAFSSDPMTEKARVMLGVLGRRREIEQYLTQLEIVREEDEPVALVSTLPSRWDERVGTPLQQDSTTIQPMPVRVIDTAQVQPSVIATNLPAQQAEAPARVPSTFSFRPEAAHAVVIVLEKVDPVYATETRNAFNRYNQENFYNQPIAITHETLNDSVRMVVLSGFSNAGPAIAYLEKVSAAAPTRIVPWLPRDKYSFLLMTEENKELLKQNQDLEGYRRFHEQYRP